MFEDIKANITILEKQGSASVDQLLESMCKLFDGAGKTNSDVSDVVLYGRWLINLFDRIYPSYHSVADKLSGLHNEDVEDVRTEAKQIFGRLKEIEPIIQQLLEEKEKYAEEKRKYDSATAKKSQLEGELASLHSVSAEDIERENQRLKDEIKRRNDNQEELRKVAEEADSATEEADGLEAAVQNKRIEIKNAEKEKERLQKEISDFDAWKDSFEQDIKIIHARATEASATYTALQNAWSSLQGDNKLSEILSTMSDLSSFGSNISSFEDLHHWFETTGRGIEQAIEVYRSMFTSVLSVYDATMK